MVGHHLHADLPLVDAVLREQSCQVQRLLRLLAGDHNAWVGRSDHPTLASRTLAAQCTVVTSLAVVGTVSSYVAEDSLGWTAQSMDLLEHLRQTLCGGETRDRWAAAHRPLEETDWMFAPCLDDRLVRQAGSAAVDRRRMNAECTLGTTLIAPSVEDHRTSNLVSQKTRSSKTCSLDRPGTAQQMLDLQKVLQTVVRCSARMVSSNLTAGTPAVYHPLTAVGLGVDATRG
jgi:hypothetical protein